MWIGLESETGRSWVGLVGLKSLLSRFEVCLVGVQSVCDRRESVRVGLQSVCSRFQVGLQSADWEICVINTTDLNPV